MADLFSIWQRQREFLDQEKLARPELFQRQPILDTPALLKQVGIQIFPPERPAVYLRLWPQDFIVEEITKDGCVHTVDYENAADLKNEEGQTVYADLVKLGISTFDAIEEIERMIGVKRRLIGYAGIKDRDAITCQQISFRNLPIEPLRVLASTNFFLKNVYPGKGALQPGDLSGNRFTLVIRGVKDFETAKIKAVLSSYEREGFWNFFYTQRFGTPRLLSHYLGLLVLKGEYEEVLKVMLTAPSNSEIGYFGNLRKTILKQWGDWPRVITLLEPLGYSFRRELVMLDHLKNSPKDFLGALRLYPDQVQLWVFAYASYLFNTKLSAFIKNGQAPDKLPLVLSHDPRDWKTYHDLLEADNLYPPFSNLRNFPTIQIKERLISTRQKFEFHGFKVADDLPKVGVTSFTLPKGSYATTLLAHLFTLSGNTPVLPSISTDTVDSKKVLGTGSIEKITDVFKGVIVSKLEASDDSTETVSE